jgi:hypothetical protein
MDSPYDNGGACEIPAKLTEENARAFRISIRRRNASKKAG